VLGERARGVSDRAPALVHMTLRRVHAETINAVGRNCLHV
jgi:hypothetical protein